MIELIEANAGAGKTTTIVNRYVELLENYHPDQVVLITFTEAASAELKEKVKECLESIKEENIRKKLVYLPTAPIGTIHGFCLELLKRFGSRYGGFKLDTIVANPLEVEKFLDTAVIEVLKKFQDKYPDDFFRLVARIDYDQPRAFKSLIAFLKDAVKNRTRYHFYRDDFTVDTMFREIDRLFMNLPLKDSEKNLSGVVVERNEKEEKKITGFLLKILKQVLKVYNGILETENKIDYSGILLKAYELVLYNDNARRDIAEHFRVFIVDEFQDTDPIQWGILKTLEEYDSEIYMLLVGDPKQSIYRFRSADLFIWNEAKRKAEKVSVSVDNYRSLPEIVTFVNLVFEHVYNGDKLGFEGELEFVPSVPRKNGKGTVLVYPMRGSKEYREKFANFAIAETFEQAEKGVVGIIGRRRSDLDPFKSVLKSYGIEFTFVSSSPYATSGIEELLYLLKWLNDPNDRKSLFFLLSSRFVGCDHTTALEIALTGSVPNDLKEFFEVCESTRKRIDKELHSVLIFSLLSKFNYLEALYLTDYTSYVSVLEVINEVFYLESREIVSFKEVIEFIEGIKVSAEQSGRKLGIAKKGYVLTTIHAAKGLEFDSVVVVPWRTRPFSGRFLFTSIGFVARLFSPEGKPEESPNFYKLRKLEDFLNYLEEKNLLYVALTRAKEKLIWGLFMDGKKNLKTGNLTFPADLFNRFVKTNTAKQPGSFSVDRNFREFSIGNIKRVELVSPSKADKEFFQDKNPYLPEGVSPRDYGVVVHALCEAFVKGASKEKAIEYALSHIPYWVKALESRLGEIYSVLSSEFPYLRESMVEVPFAYTEGNKVVKGRVDIIRETPRGIEIWDIKTGTFSREKIEAYKRQLRFYRDAFTRAGYRVAATKLLFIDENRVIDV